jgi:hypothetical protein
MAIVLRKLPKPECKNGEKTSSNKSQSGSETSESSEDTESENVEEYSQVQPVFKEKRKFQFASKKRLNKPRSSSNNAPKEEKEEVLFEASKTSSGFGEGEAQTPPPQRPRSPEGGGVVPAQPEESLPGLRTGPEPTGGAPEIKRKSHKKGDLMRIKSPPFLGASLPPCLADMDGGEVDEEGINANEREEINLDRQEEINVEKEEEKEARLEEEEEEALYPYHQEIYDWDRVQSTKHVPYLSQIGVNVTHQMPNGQKE